MRFTDWLPLSELSNSISSDSGLFQLRIAKGLLKYPNGKSAMFYYGYADNLSSGLDMFVRDVLPQLEQPSDTLLVRWLVTISMKERFRQQLDSFYTKFGSLPVGNERLLQRSKS